MTVTEAVERYYVLAGEGRPQEGLDVLLEASYAHDDPVLDHEIALCYEDRAWARCEDQSLSEGPSAESPSVWEDGTRSNEQARKDFEESLSWAERSEPLAGQAFLLLKENPDAAELLLRRAFALDSDCGLAAVVSSLLHARRQDWAEALKAAERALDALPSFPAARRALAEALMGAGRLPEALEALRGAVSKMPYNARLLVLWARALDLSGEARGAAEVWRRATLIDRLRPEAWRGLAWNAAARGDEDEMRRALEEAYRIEPEVTRIWLDREAAARPELARARPW